MVSAVNRRPPHWRTVKCEVRAENEEILDSLWAGEGAMREQSMQSDCHSEHVPEVKDQRQTAKQGYRFQKAYLVTGGEWDCLDQTMARRAVHQCPRLLETARKSIV